MKKYGKSSTAIENRIKEKSKSGLLSLREETDKKKKRVTEAEEMISSSCLN